MELPSKIDDIFQYEGYEATNGMDSYIIEESYSKISELLDKINDYYKHIERLVEHDMAMRCY